jgi:FxLD family lantipeptide
MLDTTTALAPDVEDEFDLDVTLVEVADRASLIPSTDDGCGSTCGACTTNAA